ncbi:hypothetical protein G9A89_023325 [Geosiphon pyriformis]|nr:hypothetical protein G9A89_023325 [Geosiphon pyriformis]
MSATSISEETRGRKNSSGSGLTKNYLILYNVLSWVGWSYVLWNTISNLVHTKGDFRKSYDQVGWILTWVQTTALLEVLHVGFGLVKSPLATTGIQVASRLLLVWGILNLFPEERTHWAFTTMTIAWSITEFVRYAYYGFSLIGVQPALLLWARYTFFFLLYPVGAGSESLLIYQSLPYAKKYNYVYYLTEILVLIIYAPGFYTMYTHMISQRRKYLKARKGTEKKHQ